MERVDVRFAAWPEVCLRHRMRFAAQAITAEATDLLYDYSKSPLSLGQIYNSIKLTAPGQRAPNPSTLLVHQSKH